MKNFTLFLFLLTAFAFTCNGQTTNESRTDESSKIIILNKKDNNHNRLPQKPAARPVSCVVTGNEIDVYCQYEAMGDILVVDSRTGLTVASETGVELGEDYTL